MDKRWAFIIIILLIGLGSMVLIVSNSDTVGSAIVTFSKTTITLPHGYSVDEADGYSVSLYKKDGAEKITIEDEGKKDTSKESLMNLSDEILGLEGNNTTTNITKNKINNVSVYQTEITYENGTVYLSSLYYQKHTYIIIMEKFKNKDDVDKEIKFIINTMHPDYKQSQD